MIGRRAAMFTLAGLVAAVLISVLVLRPEPRHATALPLEADSHEGPAAVRDGRGRVVLDNLRTVEPGVLYRGSAFPTTFPKADGGREYADRTAFDYLRGLNVTHVVALLDDADAYYAEDGYLRYWSDETGHRITTTWVPIDRDGAFALNDRGGVHAAGMLIAVMRERAGRGAVYLHDPDGTTHAGVAAAGYELWRNRGWHDADSLWPLVERRFAGGETAAADSGASLAGLRRIRSALLFVIEL